MDLLSNHKSQLEMPLMQNNHSTDHSVSSLHNVLIGNPVDSSQLASNKTANQVIDDCSSVSASMATLPPVTSFISSSLPSLFPLSGLNDFLVGITSLSQLSDMTSTQNETSVLQTNSSYSPSTSNNQTPSASQFLSNSLTTNNLFTPMNDFNSVITSLDNANSTKDNSGIGSTNDCISNFISGNLQSKTPLPSLNMLLKSPYQPQGLPQTNNQFQHPSSAVASSPGSPVSISKMNAGIHKNLKGVPQVKRPNSHNYGMPFGSDNSHNLDLLQPTNGSDFTNLLPPFSQESNIGLNCNIDTAQSYSQNITISPAISAMCNTGIAADHSAMVSCTNINQNTNIGCESLQLELSNMHNLNNVDSEGPNMAPRVVSNDNIQNGIFTTQSNISNLPPMISTPLSISNGNTTFSSPSLQSFTSAFGNNQPATNALTHSTNAIFSNAYLCVEETQCFKCKFCAFISLDKPVVVGHICSTHKDKVNQELNSNSGHLVKLNASDTTIIESDLRKSSNDPSVRQFSCGKCQQSFSTLHECKNHVILDHQISANKIHLRSLGNGLDKSVEENVVHNGDAANKNKLNNFLNRYIPIKQGPPPPLTMPNKQLNTASPNGHAEINKDKLDRLKKKTQQKRSTKKKKHLSQSQKAWRKKIKREQGSYICEFKGCNIRFRILDNLEFHRKCHVGGSTTFACTECSKHCEQWSSMAGHLWRNHMIDMELHACDKCSFKTYSLSMLENVHKVIHTSERPFLCDTCGKGFKSNKQLLNHKALHSNKPKSPSAMAAFCDICNRKYNTQRMLRIHMESVHKKLRPFLCNFCGYSASNQSTLRGHLRQHTGEKPFACDLCEYRTNDHNSLRRHKMRHSGEKPYKCPYCTYACIQANTFKSHLKKQHPGKDGGLLFSCSLCSFWTLKKDNYATHMAQHKVSSMQQEMLCPITNSDAVTSNNDYHSSQSEPLISSSLADGQTLGLVEAMGLHVTQSSQESLDNLSTAQFILSNLDVLEQTDVA